LFEVRHSPIHGYGVFAARRIRKGTTIIEYLGDRVSHAQADARYEDKDPNDNHTFLFTVDAKTVIDAGVNGNEARYINHGCDPNCESTTLNKRIFIEAIRTIQPGEELSYDYQIQRDSDDASNVDEVYACRCGALNCRGSMLEAAKKPRKLARRAPSRVAATKSAARKRKARRGGMAERTRRGGR
jgi:SET domain-containing protein